MISGVNNNILTLYQAQKNARSCAESPCVRSDKQENKNKELSKFSKAGIGICSAVGLCASIMLLAKFDKSRKYSLNPLKMFKNGIKNTYLAQTDFRTKEIVSMGAGSILGGLAGGEIFGRKEDSKSRIKEGLVQITNIAFPIAFVQILSSAGINLSKKIMPEWCKSKNILKNSVTKLPAAVGAMTGLVTGMFLGNRLSNKANEKIFNSKEDRPMKFKDFSAHLDDIGVAATFVAPDNIITKSISRLIPFALFVPGYETGIKQNEK